MANVFVSQLFKSNTERTICGIMEAAPEVLETPPGA